MEINSGLISSAYSYSYGLLLPYLGSMLSQAAALIAGFIAFCILFMLLITVFVYLFGWLERKLMARVHSRHGPSRVGKFGLLQNMADVLKLLSKEGIIPDNADKPLFQMVLPLLYAVFVMILIFIPITQSFVGISSSISLLVAFTLLSFTPIFMFLAGWTSGNKFGSISAQRAALILASYEVPLLFVLAGVALMAHSFSFSAIVQAQSGMWYVVLLPIGFFVFFIVMLAELERPPFDVKEADNELIAGWLTDVSAPYYGLALFLDYTRMFTGCLLISVLFLGGWSGPAILPPIAWIMGKVVLLSIMVIIVRVSLTRMRIDRILRAGWLYLFPLSVLNLILTFAIFVR